MQEAPEHQSSNSEKAHAEPLKSPIPEQVEAISDNISKMYDRFKESEQYDELQDTVTKVKEYIKKNPVQSMLMSLGAGMFLGLLFRKD